MSTKGAERAREELLANVKKELHNVPDADLEDVDAAAVGARMVAVVPRKAGRLGTIVGPLYSTKALMSMWDVSRAAVSKKVVEGKLLTLKVKGENLFPVFQFDGTKVRDDVLELVRILDSAVDPFTIAQWMRTPLEELGHSTPLEALDARKTTDAMRAAEQAAARWSM